VRYYDDEYQGRVMRAVALRVPVQPGTGRGTALIQVAERVTARDQFARLIIVRMVIPQGLLIFFAGLAVWYGVGRGLAPLSALRREIESIAGDLSRTAGRTGTAGYAADTRSAICLRALARRSRHSSGFVADAESVARRSRASRPRPSSRCGRTGGGGAGYPEEGNATEQPPVSSTSCCRSPAPSVAGGLNSEPLDLVELRAKPPPSGSAACTSISARQLARQLRAWRSVLAAEMLKSLDSAVRYPARRAGDRAGVTGRAQWRSPSRTTARHPEAERERCSSALPGAGSGAGCGLGLAIVREIALSHGGRCHRERCDGSQDGAHQPAARRVIAG
jgi:hypothetical protein